jgi:hypothetical protein
MEIRCQELRCGIKVISLDDRPWHIACGNPSCYAKREFWALYFRTLFFRWAWLIVPLSIVIAVVVAVLVTQAIWGFLVALFSIGVVWLALFLIVNLVHAFWISFGPMAGPGPQPIPPNSPWGGNPGGSGGE